MKENKTLILFLAKALILFVAWKASYALWIKDHTDLEKFLTHHVAIQSAEVFEWIYGWGTFVVDKVDESGQSYSVIYRYHYANDKIDSYSAVISIADSCNALTLMLLFIGFIIAYPGDWRWKIPFAVVGTVVIYLINLIRVQVLIYNVQYFEHTFDFNHKYTFTIAVYLAVFYMWMLWANKFSKKTWGSKTAQAG